MFQASDVTKEQPVSQCSMVLLRVQPLLCHRRINNGVMKPVSIQGIGKHVPAATNNNTTIELLLETMFSIRSVQSGCKEDNLGDSVCRPLSVESQPVKRRLRDFF
jgi:hypothetical protein